MLKIRIHLREKANNCLKLHSLATKKTDHLRVNQIQRRFSHFKRLSITFLGILMRHLPHKLMFVVTLMLLAPISNVFSLLLRCFIFFQIQLYMHHGRTKTEVRRMFLFYKRLRVTRTLSTLQRRFLALLP